MVKINWIIENKIYSRNREYGYFKKYSDGLKAYKGKTWTSKGTDNNFWYKATRDILLKKNIKKVQEAKITGKAKKWRFGSHTSFKDLINTLGFPTNKGFFTVKFGNKYYVVNEMNYDKLLDGLKDGHMEELYTTSDAEFIKYIKLDDKNQLEYFYTKTSSRKKKRGGEFFKYKSLIDFDLSRYGVLHHNNNKYNKYESDIKNYNCFQMALKIGGLDEVKLNRLCRFVKNRKIITADINKICKKLEIKINVSQRVFRNIKKPELGEIQRTVTYGKEYKEVYNLGLIDGHYFINDKECELSPFAIINYNAVKNLRDFHKIENVVYGVKGKSRYSRRSLKFTGITLMNQLLNNKSSVLTEYDKKDIMKTPFSDLHVEINNLTYDDHNVKKIKPKTKKECNFNKSCTYMNHKNNKISNKPKIKKEEEVDRPIVYFDFETYEKYDREHSRRCKRKEANKYKDFKHSEIKIHTPFLCRSETVYPNGKIIKKVFHGEDCAYKFVNSIKEDSLCIAHNLGFDFRFILSELNQIISYIDKGNNVFNAKGYMYNKKKGIWLEFKDSYQLIPKPLSAFGSCFNIEQGKEIMPYGAYNHNTINEKYISIEYAKKYLKEEDHKKFEENIDKWGLRVQDKYFKHIKYSDLYCAIDVEVLRKGYETFRGWMKQVCEIDINNKITICSLAHEYLINKGCYEGVYELSGVPREFIQKCVVGGRCMTRANKKYHCKVKIQDFDAVSLYPSAMYQMKGFLKGKPKIIQNTDYNYLSKNTNGFFCEVKINNIPKKLNFPLLSELNEEGSRIFNNDIKGNLYLDNTTLEDLIEFQELVPNVDFEIIRGYYFDEGFNDKIETVIKNLFNERKKKKAEGNQIQEVYKLIMNSAYGKTIQKPINKKKIFCDNKEDLIDKLSKNASYINSYTKIYNRNRNKIKYVIDSYNAIYEHYSIPQVGVQVLSQSKRIMNRVMCLAEDLGINIYYQDTDSMHIEENDIPKLAQAFKDKYNENLIGSELGQFHSDFDDSIKINGKTEKAKNVVSIESYFLGKKCYIDKLEKTHDDKKYYDYHIRMKGVPSSSIKLHDLDNMEIYKKLSENETIEFNLMADPFKVRMEFNNDFTINNRKSFYRNVKFEGDLIEVK